MKVCNLSFLTHFLPLIYLKEHLCLLSSRIPQTYRWHFWFRYLSIRRIRPRFFICKDVWIHWVQQKKSSIHQPYWRRFLTCKWKLSFEKRDQTENNMQFSYNILVLHLHCRCCILEELQPHCVAERFSKDFHILTYLDNRSSKWSWAFFG